MVEELDLLRRAQALDNEALAEIHDNYYQGIYRYFSFRTPDHQTAEDLTSEVFMRFLQAIRDKQAPPNTIRGWLFGTARNVSKEYYRRRSKRETILLSESLPGSEDSVETGLSNRMDRRQLARAMKLLTADQQHVLALRFGYGLPIREVAKEIDKSEAAVKMLQARAILALSKQMETQS